MLLVHIEANSLSFGITTVSCPFSAVIVKLSAKPSEANVAVAVLNAVAGSWRSKLLLSVLVTVEAVKSAWRCLDEGL